jgi:hypothetical protein
MTRAWRDGELRSIATAGLQDGFCANLMQDESDSEVAEGGAAARRRKAEFCAIGD